MAKNEDNNLVEKSLLNCLMLTLKLPITWKIELVIV